MRTVQEIDQHITDCEMALADNSGYIPCEDDAYNGGMAAGFRRAKSMIIAGCTSAEILDFARASQRAYVSRGMALSDAHQSGYTTALSWAGEEFDWDDQGNVWFPTDKLCPICECKLWSPEPDQRQVVCRECNWDSSIPF